MGSRHEKRVGNTYKQAGRACNKYLQVPHSRSIICGACGFSKDDHLPCQNWQWNGQIGLGRACANCGFCHMDACKDYDESAEGPTIGGRRACSYCGLSLEKHEVLPEVLITISRVADGFSATKMNGDSVGNAL